ncbi:MAG: hypothetical protein JXR84_05075 [Anaerolineae bacterium]|nr:hypothetical protein [Anaerolineae bacterium]
MMLSIPERENRVLKRVIPLLLLTLLFTGCSERVRTVRVLPEWGRANLIGVASNATPLGLVATSDGDQVIMVWPTRAENASQDYLHLFVLDADGDVVFDQNLEPAIPNLYEAQLLLEMEDDVHLLWIAGERDARVVWYAHLGKVDPSRVASLAAEPVSPSNQSVAWYKAALLPSGDILVLWLDMRGELSGQLIDRGIPQKLLSDVIGVDFQIDAAGNVHLVWSQQESPTQVAFYQAQLAADSLQLASTFLATTVFLPARIQVSSIEGPMLALDRRYAYITWVQREDQPNRIVKSLHTVAWPLAGTTESYEMESLIHNADFPPSTARVTGYFAYQHLAASSSSRGNSLNVYQLPTTIRTQEEEMVLALSVQYATRTRAEYQPTLVYMQDGELLGYQALTWTDHTSSSPVVTTDATHNLYAAWTDATGADFHYPIYLASTAPALRVSWQHMTLADYGTVAWDYINRIASGIVLFPLIVVWFFLPIAWLFFKLARGGDVFGLAGQRLLLSTLWLYWAAKYLLTFQILTYVPGLRYVTSNAGTVLIFCVPLLTLAFGVIVGGLLTIRWTNKGFSVMRTFLVSSTADALLSLAIYAVGYFE